MKKRIVAGLLVCVMTLAFAMPTMASDVSMVMVTAEIEEPITPFHELTRIYWRTYRGELQMRVWGITSGRWLTDWMTVTPA